MSEAETKTCLRNGAPAAPTEETFTRYDAEQMLTYARLLDVAKSDITWEIAAAEILLLDVAADPRAAEHCWKSHLTRAHWIVSEEGLAAAAASELWDQPDS